MSKLSYIRPRLFIASFALMSIMIGVFGFVVAKFKGKKFYGFIRDNWVRATLKLLSWTCNIQFNFQGQENLPPGIPVIIAGNHQSYWETIVYNLLFRDPCFICKKEATRLFVIGEYLNKTEQIIIDRNENVQALKKILRGSKAALNKGRDLVIFPEGTRLSVGDRSAMKVGIYAIYKANPDTPLLPIKTNAGEFWAKGLFPTRSGEIQAVLYPPVKKGMTSEELLETLSQIYYN